LSTDLDDVIAESTLISAESTATAAVADGIAAGTTSLSTDLDDVIATSTLIAAESTATAAVVDLIGAETSAHSTELEQLTSASSRLEAEATSHTTTLQLLTSATTTLSTDIDDLISSTTLIHAESTATAAVVDGIAAGTTMLSTDADDLISSTTAIQANLPDNLALTAISSAVWDEVLTAATHNVAASAGRRLRTLDAAFVVHDGTAAAGGAASITFTGASTSDDFYNGDRVIIVDGTGAGEHGLITDYDGGTLVATMAQNWVIQPDVTSVYEVVPADVDVETVGNVVQTGGDLAALITTVDGVVDGIASGTTMVSTDLDDLISTTTALSAEATSHTTQLEALTSASSRLEASTTAIMAGTTSLSTDLDDLIATSTLIAAESTATAAVVDSIAAGTTTLSTDLDDVIATSTAILDDTGVSGVLLSTAAADTVWTATIVELSTAMNATPTVLDILAFHHMKHWNLNVTTATSGYDIVYNDAGSTVFIANITQPTTASFQRAQYTT
jgi:hypothetical protein